MSATAETARPQIAAGLEGEVYHAPKPVSIEGVRVIENRQNTDDRQSLIVYHTAKEYPTVAQSYVAICDRGVIKAWHYHLEQTDLWFVPYGKIKVGLYDAREGSATFGQVNEVVMGDGRPVTLIIPPGVYHGYVTLTDRSILINTTNKGYNPNDEYRISFDDARIPMNWSVENR